MNRWLFLPLCLLILGSVRLLGESTPALDDAIVLRGNFSQSLQTFEKTKSGRVAFIGGSITEMEGYRPRVMQYLRQRFPDTAFTFINAGIASTCSNTGAFRLERDVLSKGPIDLLFVDFAVNDDQDGHFTREECVRGMEGIVRHVREKSPRTDIVLLYFANEGMMREITAGRTPVSVGAHEEVASLYGASSVNIVKELTREIAAGTISWKTYGGVHPAPAGADFCARLIEQCLDHAWAAAASSPAVASTALPAPLRADSYFHGHFIDPGQARVARGWTLGVPDWKAIPGGKRAAFTAIPMLAATEPGAELSLDFEGSAIGAFIVAGPDAGKVECRIDDGPTRTIDLFTPYSGGLHYPYTVMFGQDLAPGKHTLHLRTSEETRGQGHAMRIMEFCAS